MQLSQWNRFRNDTFKDRRDDELSFIPGQAPAAEGGVTVNGSAAAEEVKEDGMIKKLSLVLHVYIFK